LFRALDDEIPIEVLMPDHHVLHPEPLGNVAEKSTTMDGESEVAGVDVGCSQTSESHGGFARGHHVSIQRDGPFTVRDLDLVSLPKAALNIVRTGFSAKLSPNFRFAWTEHFSQRFHSVSVIANARSAAQTVWPAMKMNRAPALQEPWASHRKNRPAPLGGRRGRTVAPRLSRRWFM